MLRFVLTIAFVCAATAAASAQPNKDKDPLSFDRNIGGLLNRYCYRCHGRNETHGDVDLARDQNPGLIVQNHRTWRTALELIEDQEMPPEDSRQPTEEERALIVEFLRNTLDQLDCETTTEPGPPILRRLSGIEYDRSILDLTGLDLQLSKDFPADPLSYGFDNIGNVLQLSPVQVETYHTAAQKIVAELLSDPRSNAARHVFDVDVDESSSPKEHAKRVLQRFANRAFRRPAPDRFVERLMLIYSQAVDQGIQHREAIGHGITAVLISPRFLSRVEQADLEAPGSYLVDDYDMASRLSFFLWSSPPDQELLDLAAKGELNNPAMLAEQTKRMLRDPKSQALADHFFGQWLGLGQLETHRPDAATFAEFDDSLRSAMREEVRHYLSDLIREDRSLMSMVRSDYTFVNGRLAEHYGRSGIEGSDFRKVTWTDGRRGGLLTSAALLMLASDPERTNIPRRGNFLASTILGDGPPPPPPDVPELESTGEEDAELTLRERLALHRSRAECQSCHDRIDPFGFALENYDAIGRWRDEELGQPIDATSQLSNGKELSGPADLRAYVAGQRSKLMRNLIENLLIYALGRGLIAEDECVVLASMRAGAERGDRCSDVIVSIVLSHPFRYRRNPY